MVCQLNWPSLVLSQNGFVAVYSTEILYGKICIPPEDGYGAVPLNHPSSPPAWFPGALCIVHF